MTRQLLLNCLSRVITQMTNSIKVAVTKYNAALSFWKNRVEGLPEAMKFDEMKDSESPIYEHFRAASSTMDEVPFVVKRNAIDLHNYVERCKEENEYLNDEMVRLIKHKKLEGSFTIFSR